MAAPFFAGCRRGGIAVSALLVMTGILFSAASGCGGGSSAAAAEQSARLVSIGDGPDRAQRFAAERPDRFSLGVGGFNLLQPMPALRALQRRSCAIIRSPTQ